MRPCALEGQLEAREAKWSRSYDLSRRREREGERKGKRERGGGERGSRRERLAKPPSRIAIPSHIVI